MLALEGATETDVSVLASAVTARDALPLIPLSDAATIVEPAATPVARPLEFVVAIDAGDSVQLAVELTLAVELSL
jgi:hypothetical protein